jgi:hypothetical protein
MVVALIALFIALDGPAAAKHLIDGRTIERNSITSAQIRNRTIGTQDLSRTALRTLLATPAGSIGTRELMPKAVDASKIVDGAVGSAAISDKTVGAGDLADGAVGPAQISPGAITASKLADGAIGAGAIADGGLTGKDIGDFYGTVNIDFRPFDPNTCQVAADIVPNPSMPGQGNAIADDAIVVSPFTSGDVGWPDPIVVTAKPGATGTIRIVACRIGADPTDPTAQLDPGPTLFSYVAFDEP